MPVFCLAGESRNLTQISKYVVIYLQKIWQRKDNCFRLRSHSHLGLWDFYLLQSLSCDFGSKLVYCEMSKSLCVHMRSPTGEKICRLFLHTESDRLELYVSCRIRRNFLWMFPNFLPIVNQVSSLPFISDKPDFACALVGKLHAPCRPSHLIMGEVEHSAVSTLLWYARQ